VVLAFQVFVEKTYGIAFLPDRSGSKVKILHIRLLAQAPSNIVPAV
jgi:hypothetical protein